MNVFEKMQKIADVCPKGTVFEEALCDALRRYYLERLQRIHRTKALMSPGDAQSQGEFADAMRELQTFEEGVYKKRLTENGYEEAEVTVANLIYEMTDRYTEVNQKSSSLFSYYFQTHGGCHEYHSK